MSEPSDTDTSDTGLTHEPGCECLEFGCTAGIETHGCRCRFTARRGDYIMSASAVEHYGRQVMEAMERKRRQGEEPGP